MVKRIFRELFLGKIAAVDRPCQEPAIMAIMKRAPAETDDLLAFYKAKYSADDRKTMAGEGAAMSDGSYPIKDAGDLEKAIHAVGRGKNNSHAAIRRHIKARAKALGLSDQIPDEWTGSEVGKVLDEMLAKAGVTTNIAAETFAEKFDDQLMLHKLWDDFWKAQAALQQSIESIIKDDEVTDKTAMVQQSLDEFCDYVAQLVPNDITKSLTAGLLAATHAGAAGATVKGDPMTNAVKKALGLPDTATDADVTKALEAQSAALAKADKLAKMSAKHKAFHEKLTGDAADKFADMSSDQRDTEMAKAAPPDLEKALASGDAFKADDGTILTKRDFGTDAGFQFAKSQAVKNTALAAEVAKGVETNTVANFAKRATDIGQPVEFGVTLRKAYSGDAVAQTEVEKQIGALQKQVSEGKLFDTLGSSVVKAGSALAALNAKRDEVMKTDPKLTEAQAFSKVYQDRANAEIVKQYKQESGATH